MDRNLLHPGRLPHHSACLPPHDGSARSVSAGKVPRRPCADSVQAVEREAGLTSGAVHQELVDGGAFLERLRVLGMTPDEYKAAQRLRRVKRCAAPAALALAAAMSHWTRRYRR